jgi:hypothetical protein
MRPEAVAGQRKRSPFCAGEAGGLLPVDVDGLDDLGRHPGVRRTNRLIGHTCVRRAVAPEEGRRGVAEVRHLVTEGVVGGRGGDDLQMNGVRRIGGLLVCPAGGTLPLMERVEAEEQDMTFLASPPAGLSLLHQVSYCDAVVAALADVVARAGGARGGRLLAVAQQALTLLARAPAPFESGRVVAEVDRILAAGRGVVWSSGGARTL